MTTTIYGIKACSTMKKAFTKLDELGVEYEFFDYKKQSITTEKVSAWVEELGIEKVLNKRGTTWRKQTDEDKEKADADIEFAIELLVNNTSMIKRPIIETTNENQAVLLCGYDEADITSIFYK